MVAASRVTYAYARDDCFPLSRIWKQVHPVTKTPVMAVWFNCVIGILLLLLIFAGDIAISAIFSVGAIAAFVAFTIPIAIRVFFVGNRFRPGPWHLGKFSRPIGALATFFVILMVPILCLPTTTISRSGLDAAGMVCLMLTLKTSFATIVFFANFDCIELDMSSLWRPDVNRDRVVVC